MSAKKKAKDKEVKTESVSDETTKTVLTEVPPIETETVSETAELLTEVPEIPTDEVIVENKVLVEAPKETLISEQLGNTFTGDFAPAPNPRAPRGTKREKVEKGEMDISSLTLKQKRALLGSFSKKTLRGRFGIKF